MGGLGGPGRETPASPRPPCSRVPTSASPGTFGGSQVSFPPETSVCNWGGWRMRMVSSLCLGPFSPHPPSLPWRHTPLSSDGALMVSLAELSGHPAAAHPFLCDAACEPHTPDATLASPPSLTASPTFSLRKWQLYPQSPQPETWVSSRQIPHLHPQGGAFHPPKHLLDPPLCPSPLHSSGPSHH